MDRFSPARPASSAAGRFRLARVAGLAPELLALGGGADEALDLEDLVDAVLEGGELVGAVRSPW